MNWTPAETTRLGGLDITTADRPELLRLFAADRALVAQAGRWRPRLVFDANAQGLSLGRSDHGYRAALDAADLIHADGGVLVTLSRWLGPRRIAGRSCTTDMFADLAGEGARHGWRFYLLGGTESANARCAALLAERHPGLVVAGRHHGFFDDLDAVVADIGRARPDIVWIGMGKPVEQTLAVTLAGRVAATWAVTCGGCFNYLIGDYPRAPLWMQNNNLEWLHRLLSDPKRLGWRYLTTNPHALWVIVSAAWRERRSRRSPTAPSRRRAGSVSPI